jgi:glutaminyl-peptide cyclotransferase
MENRRLKIVKCVKRLSQHYRLTIFHFSFSLFLILMVGCDPAHKELVDNIVLHPAPEFIADSAYSHISKQVSFGPRIPGLESHAQCGDYLVERLRSYSAEVIEQQDSVTVAYAKRLPVRNIIASFSPENEDRILLFAHWDSRPMADMDNHRHFEPIEAAHDGASGVGVLLEVARLIGIEAPKVGVDIILFDTEDQGKTWEDGDDFNTEFFYSMGTRFWAKNKHREGYAARFGIMLDMVAAADARFTLERYSMDFAGEEMKRVWATAHRLGHTERFPFNLTREVMHDHYHVNKLAGIPSIAIMHHDNTSKTSFGSYWHTHDDDLSSIDKATLGAVGQTVVQVVFNEGR